MLRRATIPRRVPLAVLLAATLSVLFVPVALAAGWNSSCGDQEACVWKDASFGVPKAAKDASDAQYNTDDWPNTTDNMNDETSSIKNKFNVKSVVWFFDSGYSGTSYCLPANWESGDLNNHNDDYSSHLIAVGSTC